MAPQNLRSYEDRNKGAKTKGSQTFLWPLFWNARKFDSAIMKRTREEGTTSHLYIHPTYSARQPTPITSLYV